METDFGYLEHSESLGKLELRSLMDQYGDDVLQYAYTMTKNRERAQDIAQEVFIRVHRKISSFRGQSSLKTWLLAITRNVAINEIRSSYIRRVLLLGKVEDRHTSKSAETQFLEQQGAEHLWELIMSLSVKLREVLVLDLEHELTIREIACLLGISEGTVKSRLHRARKAVEAKWKEADR